MIENTSERGPGRHLVEVGITAALGSPDPMSDYITGMEADGQRQIVASDLLPTRILHCTREDFEALGFVFGAEVGGDPLFQHATLPEGWRREGSDHDMWSYIVDGEGKRRVAIFYKAGSRPIREGRDG